MDGVTVRPRTDDDLDACIHVLQRVYKKSGYPVGGVANPMPFLQFDTLTKAWVAEKGGVPVGHVSVSEGAKSDPAADLWRQQNPHSKAAILERLFIDPSAQGLGIAGKLISTAVGWANERGLRLILFVLLKDGSAKSLYEKLGWQHFGTGKYRYGDNQEMGALCYVSPESQ